MLPLRKKKPIRRLFLDDDPERAKAFLEANPDAVWVQTAADCVAKLAESWDEVHLDHDLGGEVFVDHEREDCGMAVVRWLCDQPRTHLQATQFIVHTHNPDAACMMHLHLEVMGYDVRVRPFDHATPGRDRTDDLSQDRGSRIGRLIRWLWSLVSP
jgi:hypothetical protein